MYSEQFVSRDATLRVLFVIASFTIAVDAGYAQCTGGPDCNNNGVSDSCEIANGTVADSDSDGYPDECGKIYWQVRQVRGEETYEGEHLLRSVNTDGSNVVSISGQSSQELALDLIAGKIYWSRDLWLRAADLDGSNTQTLMSDVWIARQMDLDVASGWIYWVDDLGNMWRARLDGTQATFLFSLPTDTGSGLVFDRHRNMLYWSSFSDRTIWRANSNGTSLELIFSGGSVLPIHLALDYCNEKLYWSDSNGDLMRSDLDGANVEPRLTGASVGDFDLDHVHDRIYLTSQSGDIRHTPLSNPGSFSNFGIVDYPYGELIVVDTGDADCNGNGVVDQCDIAAGIESDCNANALPDSCDAPQADCNSNGIADGCDLTDATSNDCNTNSIPDECEPPQDDCNTNGVADGCDIAQAVSFDCDGNLIPNECEQGAVGSSRYLTLRFDEDSMPIAIWMTGDPSDADISCVSGYIQLDGSLGTDPVFQSRSQWCKTDVTGSEIIPDRAYLVQYDDGSTLSPPIEILTAKWGDVTKNFVQGAWEPPDGIVKILDAVAAMDRFQGLPDAPPVAQCDMWPQEPDGVIAITDIVAILGAFEGDVYPFTPPCGG